MTEQDLRLKAARALQLPSIFLMIATVLSGLYQLASLFVGRPDIATRFGDDPNFAEAAEFMEKVGGPALGIFFLLIQFLIFFGALKMKSVSNYGLSMTAAILACIPCLSPCCILGIPFGIWALVVLLRDETRKAFSAI